MRSLVPDATPYKQGLRESLDFGSCLSANRTPNVRLGCVKTSDKRAKRHFGSRVEISTPMKSMA